MANTIICLNHNCLTVNPINQQFCQKCQGKLLLKDRYQAIKLIGKGGFGRTFLAKDLDQSSATYCVIKEFFPMTQDPENLAKASELFFQEAKRLEQLGQHPQIPEFFAYFVTETGQQYLIQKYIAGDNLQTELKNHGPFSEQQIRNLLIDVLHILKFIHTNQVIHRDIKPENIIRNIHDQKLVLVDFGAAKYIPSHTALYFTGTVIGSAQYCAPEQARGKSIFASDLYSLGVTCIYLLTQVEPFQLFDISENDWVWRDYLVDNPVSEDLANILDRLITVGLKKRFANVDQVLEAMNCQPSTSQQQLIPSLSTPEQSLDISTLLLNQNQTEDISSHKSNNNLKITTVEFSTTNITLIKRGSNRKNIKLCREKRKGTCKIATFDLGQGVNLEMVYIPGGSFLMGSEEKEYEKPIHLVNIPPFYMGKYHITQKQYFSIMGENPAYYQGENRPVEKVSWYMAQQFCARLSDLTNIKFSLPTESCWEYACRAGTTTPFYCGETITTDLANFDGNYSYNTDLKGIYRRKTTNVGIFPPNPFGLYDMHGNVWEWCEDTWHNNYIGAPNDGSAWVLPDSKRKVLRGGSWLYSPADCRVSSRHNSNQEALYIFGFRVCCGMLYRQ